ncbi:TraX family protein [Clostridium sp. D33t1_170424_F3]|uniref:TraX family protein n=1 Tax=Clostridium sp. D33t1_170424_F3 TaxID=2787099 RepID=UPI0018A9EF49|nr:TraX family protein [Clostridium sp. D33t1_170424_F3]
MKQKSLTGNQLKIIAVIAMTIDHLTSVLYPNYPTDWWIVTLHIIGRLAAPVFWFFIAEGYHHTHDRKKYAIRLFAFAIVSHFAYCFAFGIPFIPFQTSVFNQTSVIWSLAWGLAALAIHESKRFKPWQKAVLILGITGIAFCADWSSIAVLAIVQIGANHGNFKKQMAMMLLWVSVYAAVYAVFINPVYGVLQLSVVLTVLLLKLYHGEQGTWKGMKWFFYLYYPLHLTICGLLRLALHGNVGVMIGG